MLAQSMLARTEVIRTFDPPGAAAKRPSAIRSFNPSRSESAHAIAASPRMAGQRALVESIDASPFIVSQRQRIQSFTNISTDGGPDAASVIQGKFHWEINEENEKEKDLKQTFDTDLMGSRWAVLLSDEDFWVVLTIDASAEPNPAEVSAPYSTTAKSRKVKAVNLGIRRWFVESYGTGTTVAMLNHEIAVHVMPYYDKIMENLDDERKGRKGRHEEEDLGAQERAGIDDHRRAMEEGSPEFNLYLDFAVSSAAALKSAGRIDDAREVLFSYLMDLASMAESGSKGEIARKALIPIGGQDEALTYVVDRYNRLAAQVQEHAEKSGLAEIFGDIRRVSKATVWNEFKTFRSRVPLAKFAVQTARGNPKTTFAVSAALTLIAYLAYLWWTASGSASTFGAE